MTLTTVTRYVDEESIHVINMMNFRFNLFVQRSLFLLGISTIYLGLLLWLDFLQAPPIWDEHHFWETSLTFSHQLIPSLDTIKNYGELNTPLPFIIFGMLEYIFHQGIAAGRLLNMILSVIVLVLIGWPTQEKKNQALRCAIGLILFPYFLWYGSLLYTDTIPGFLVLMGVIFYIRNSLILSCFALILAIASRQFAIAFPAAIALYELISLITRDKHQNQAHVPSRWRWLIAFIPVASILGWIVLFQGLAPAGGMGRAPDVQATLWALDPGIAINFLAFVGFYIVIPELILFQSSEWIKISKPQIQKTSIIAAGLLSYVIIFPPSLGGLGTIVKLVDILPYDALKIALIYVLALLACIRFSKPNLMSLTILLNSFIMMKAISWDKYLMPVAIIFWYLKSIEMEDSFPISWGHQQKFMDCK